MDSKPPALPNTKSPSQSKNKDRDFLNHLEAHLAKREGIDKLLKITNYATKIILASSVLPETLTLTERLKNFDSSVALSRKAFRLGKFLQALNALRDSHFDSKQELILSAIAYVGDGLYYFVEQFIWLVYAGLIDHKHLHKLEKISIWAEFIGYFGSISLTIRDLKKINEDAACLKSRIKIAISRGIGYQEEKDRMRELREEKLIYKLSVLQDLAELFMAISDIWDCKGRFSGPLLLASAGLISAVISSHRTWNSC